MSLFQGLNYTRDMFLGKEKVSSFQGLNYTRDMFLGKEKVSSFQGLNYTRDMFLGKEKVSSFQGCPSREAIVNQIARLHNYLSSFETQSMYRRTVCRDRNIKWNGQSFRHVDRNGRN